MSSKPPLKEFQRENVEWIQRVRRGLLADEPGLGKSRSALEGVKGADRVLIVAPNLILQSGVWDDEVELWGDDDTRYFTATYHDLNKRRKTGKTASSTKPVKVLHDGIKGHWDAIILDEAHYIKGRDSLWTWSAKQLARNCDMWMLLTGTPIPNWSHEVFTLLQTIYPEEGKVGNELLGSFWRWAERYFEVTPNPHNPRAKILREMRGCTPACMRRDPDDPCEHYRRFTEANFGDRYMRHMRKDHLDLPPIEFRDIATSLDRSGREIYRSLKKDFAAEVDGHDVLAWSQGAKNVLLDKLTTSPWLLTKEGEPHGGKLDILRGLVEKRDEPTFVVAHYRDSVEAAARVAHLAGKRSAYIHGGTTDRQNADAIQRFKTGGLDVLVGSLETVSEGLTLTVADHAIFLERSYKPSRNVQATYRIYRMGQDKACTVTRLITPNSVDSGKEKLLKAKTDHQMRTLTAADFLRVA
jgi:SNF2 family DNA or RNA helicase